MTQMTNRSTFELLTFLDRPHAAPESANGDPGMPGMPWQDDNQRSKAVLEFFVNEREQDHAIRVGIEKGTGCPCPVTDQQDSIAGFAVIKRRLGSALTMTTHRGGVIVNGLPALSFTVLLPRDSVVIAPGVHSYVTERIRPYIGAPLPESIGVKCPFCRIPVTHDTRVVSCRCGVVYHHETEESHGAINEKDRLDCLSKIRVCLSCSRPVTLEESLVWDPETL